MKQQLVITLGLIAFATLMAREANAQKGDADELQGTWVVTAYEIDGKTAPVPAGGRRRDFHLARIGRLCFG